MAYNLIRLLTGAALSLILLLHGALAAPSPPDEHVELPTGEARATTADDLRPHRSLGSAYNEVWSYTFLLNDGMQATMSLSKADLGSIMAPVSGAEFSISGFDGRSHRAPKQYDADDLVFTPSTNRLQVHPDIFFEGALPQRH